MDWRNGFDDEIYILKSTVIHITFNEWKSCPLVRC